MKISQEKPKFTPITLTIESMGELEWLAAISDTAVTTAATNANNQGFELSKEAQMFQMSFYNEIVRIREERS